MGRRSGFTGVIFAVAREAARTQRRAQVEKSRAYNAHLREQKNSERTAAKTDKERYIQLRFDEANDMTKEIVDKVEELKKVVEHTLSVDDRIDFESLRIKDKFRSFKPDKKLITPYPKPLEMHFVEAVKPLKFASKLIPGSSERHQKAISEAKIKYQEAHREFEKNELERRTALKKAEMDYLNEKIVFELKIKQRDVEVDELENNYKKGDPAAVCSYNTMVLERSEYPDGFPQEFKIAYVPESKQLVVDYELPNSDVVPKIQEYKYIKSKDSFEEKLRKPAEIKDIYQDIISAIALRTCHELFEADQGNHLEAIVFNGFVQTVDPSTGKDIRPFLISVRTIKEKFLEIDLARVEKKACLRNLGAQLSPRPYEVQPVKPIVDFNMVDKRFVEQSDILADLESRPNLMDLNPFEFENLVSNLFGKMGLETKLTRSSRDGGVDAVAFDIRPVIGGKVVIQAKRYKNTVGVSAVRDLYGTMMNEGANKGILVTTSGYGPDAFNFSKDKPIELIDGGQLLYLLEQVGVNARIVFPEDWKDN